MLGYIWGGMMVLAVVFVAFNGRLAEVTAGALAGAEDAVGMTVSLLGIMCFWTGMMKIAEETGVIRGVARLLRPLMRLLFPRLRDQKALRAIVMNMTANMLGMSNAATPLGLQAMQELRRCAGGRLPTDEMCMFIVINTASIQLIPSTVIALRRAAESANPFEIIVPIWAASLAAVTVGVLSAKSMARRRE